MGDVFVIELVHEGTVLPVEVFLVNVHYSYRASVTLNDIEVIYKPEEYGHRAMIKKNKNRVISEEEKTIIDLVGEELTARMYHDAMVFA